MAKCKTLGDRMKNLEMSSSQRVMSGVPVIMRLDGKAFHTYTRNLNRPFDDGFIKNMSLVALLLCRRIATVQMAYVQSDEISLLLNSYRRVKTEPWFDNRIQKAVSVAASEASAIMSLLTQRLTREDPKILSITDDEELCKTIERQMATFDCRMNPYPESEVANYFIWRQKDASKNSVSMFARSFYSQKELQGKQRPQLQEMLFQKGLNWNNQETYKKRGFTVVKNEKGVWEVDWEPPIFTEDRQYIERFLGREGE